MLTKIIQAQSCIYHFNRHLLGPTVRDYWRPCRFINGQNKVPALVELEKRMQEREMSKLIINKMVMIRAKEKK